MPSFDPLPRRRKSAAAPAPKPKAAATAAELAELRVEIAFIKSAAPAVDPAEHAAVKAAPASLRAEVAEPKDAPAAARRRETLKNVVIADMQWRSQIR